MDTTGGLGLGLYICRQIVMAHGGTICATNAQGGGALLTVEMPRQALGIALAVGRMSNPASPSALG